MKQIKVRPYFSYSQMSAFKYSPARFLRNYYYGEFEDNQYLQLGKRLGTALQFRDKKEIAIINKIREQIPEAKVYEKELKAKFNGTRLIGYLDGWDERKLEIMEFKTGKRPSEASWRAQMTFYSTILFIRRKKLPSKITLYWAETKFDENDVLILTGKVKMYNIIVTLLDVIQFSAKLIKTYNDIQKLIDQEYQMYNILPKYMKK